MKLLPVNLEDLIHARSVESERREFKKTWNDVIRDAVIKTIAAFANDFHNLNGGYIILGIEDRGGAPVLPPCGLDGIDLEKLQKDIRGNCKNIDPEYQPVLSPEVFMDKQILVIWAPGGEVRPYQAPEKRGEAKRPYIRLGSETVESKGENLTQLIQLTARVPFDDRRRNDATLNDISGILVRDFLLDIRSDLVSPDAQFDLADQLRNLRCSKKVNGHEVPRNVALMFFCNDPERFFSGTRIEVACFPDDAGGDIIEEKIFRGPLHSMAVAALEYLKRLNADIVQKIPGQEKALHYSAFPFEALEEALVNALIHRDYEYPPEPVKVLIYPDSMVIASHPGPLPGFKPEHFNAGAKLPQIIQRNRRIGEFFKELKLAELHNTGIQKIFRAMKINGSPEPVFEFDEGRTYFQVTLPIHPAFLKSKTP